MLRAHQKRRAGYLAAISRGDVTEKILSNGRICSRHFISGKPAALEYVTNLDWLPSLNLGHSKVSDSQVELQSGGGVEGKLEKMHELHSYLAIEDAVQGLLALADPAVSEMESSEVSNNVSIQTDISSNVVSSVHASMIYTLINRLHRCKVSSTLVYEVPFVSKPISKSMFVNRSMFAM